jgi:hypothetical protein
MQKEQIEQAAKEVYTIKTFQKIWIAGANFVNERQPYTAEDMQGYLNFVLKIIKECQDSCMSFSEKYNIKSNHELLGCKVKEEQK